MLKTARSESEVEVRNKVEQAAAGMIWSSLNEVRYIFRHALLRDAAYGMQLRAHLRGLHALAGQAIEIVCPADLPPHYADLSYHYGQAGDVGKECRFARLAGEYAVSRFANAEAVSYLSRALDLTPPAELAERFTLLLAREKVNDLQGKRGAQQLVAPGRPSPRRSRSKIGKKMAPA